jgi:hypothetical protein
MSTPSPSITRSPGVIVSHGLSTVIVGGGGRGASDLLDETIARAAEQLRDLFNMDVTIRYNSDGRSGGAWVVTHERDRVWANAEIGITGGLHHETGELQISTLLSRRALIDPTISTATRRDDGDLRTHKTLSDAVSFVRDHAQVPEISPWESIGIAESTWHYRRNLHTLVGQRVRITFENRSYSQDLRGDLTQASDGTYRIGSERLTDDGMPRYREFWVAKVETKVGARFAEVDGFLTTS